MSGVFRTIDPPPPLPLASVSLSSHRIKGGGGGVHTRRGMRGWGGGFNISEDARHWIGLLQYNPSTPDFIADSAPQTMECGGWTHLKRIMEGRDKGNSRVLFETSFNLKQPKRNQI